MTLNFSSFSSWLLTSPATTAAAADEAADDARPAVLVKAWEAEEDSKEEEGEGEEASTRRSFSATSYISLRSGLSHEGSSRLLTAPEKVLTFLMARPMLLLLLLLLLPPFEECVGVLTALPVGLYEWWVS